MTTKLTMGILLTVVAGCSAEGGDKNVVAPDFSSGKADATDVLAQTDPLAFEGEARGEFTRDLEFHGYTFAGVAGAKLKVDVTHLGSSSQLDTTMFLFGPKTALHGYGDEAMLFDDDDGWGRLSRLDDVELDETGEYLIVIGTASGSRNRGNYRLTLECLSDECDQIDIPPPETCPEGVAELVDECIADLTFDTQDAEFAVLQCTDSGSFEDNFDINCGGGFFIDEEICLAGVTNFMETVAPVCRDEFRAQLPTTELNLSGTFLSDQLEDLLFELQEECFDAFCNAEMDAWTYTGDDPTVEEAVEAIRTKLDFGFEYNNRGAISVADAQQRVDRFNGFVSLSENQSDTELGGIGLATRTFIPFANVDAFSDRVILLYPDSNMIFTYEHTVFFD